MHRYLFILYILFATPVFSQVFPRENDTLNYRLIGFTFPEVEKAENYTVEIASGNYINDKGFTKNIVKTVGSHSNKLVTIVPSFGCNYTWRVRYLGPASKYSTGKFYHFTVDSNTYADTAKARIRITKSPENYKDAYFFMDGTRTLYDMYGNALWFLPKIEGEKNFSLVRDLKLSCKGTITFLGGSQAYEIDYRGKVLWKGPDVRKSKDDTMKGYHHQFTRLANGHYMVLSFDPFVKPKPQQQRRDSAGHIIRDTSRVRKFPERIYGTVLEYDEEGRLVWEWQAKKYFDTTDLSYYLIENGIQERDVHENAFFFDEKNKVVYVSFRNLGQILKVSYPSGKVLNAYGKISRKGDSMEAHFFCGQHSCNLSEDGHLYLYDNGCTFKSVPGVVMLQEPVSDTDVLKEVWEFKCPVDTGIIPLSERRAVRLHMKYAFSAGGNVTELPDHSFFVSTNTPFGEIFIVTMDKKVTWSAFAEKWQNNKETWKPLIQYRSSIITDPRQLENVIFNSMEPE